MVWFSGDFVSKWRDSMDCLRQDKCNKIFNIIHPSVLSSIIVLQYVSALHFLRQIFWTFTICRFFDVKGMQNKVITLLSLNGSKTGRQAIRIKDSDGWCRKWLLFFSSIVLFQYEIRNVVNSWFCDRTQVFFLKRSYSRIDVVNNCGNGHLLQVCCTESTMLVFSGYTTIFFLIMGLYCFYNHALQVGFMIKGANIFRSRNKQFTATDYKSHSFSVFRSWNKDVPVRDNLLTGQTFAIVFHLGSNNFPVMEINFRAQQNAGGGSAGRRRGAK